MGQPKREHDDRRDKLHYDIRLNNDGTIVFNVRDARGALKYTGGVINPENSPEVMAVSDGLIRDKTIDEQLADQIKRDADAKTKAELEAVKVVEGSRKIS